MNLNALKTRLAELYPGTDPLTPAQVAAAGDALRADTTPTLRPVNSKTLLLWAAKFGARARLKAAMVNADAPAAIKSICDDALLMLERDNTELDLGNADIQAMLAALVQAGVLTSQMTDALTTIATVQEPRWPDLLCPDHVAQARELV